MKVSYAVRAACVALSLTAAAPAVLAADLTVTAYGGAWEQAYRKCFVQPFEKSTGKSVDVILGSPMQWINQIAANPTHPPIDVMIGLVDSGEIARQRGLVEPIDESKIPNLKDIKPQMRAYGKGYGFPIAFGDFGLMYSKKSVPNPPKTWKEFVDGTNAGKWHAALPGIAYVGTAQGLIGLFAMVYGGSLDNVQPGLDQIKRMQKSGNVTFYSEPNSPLVALKSNDVDIAMYFDGRAWAEHDANNPDIGYLNPKPGAVAFPTMVQKVKNGSPLGLQFMNVIASAEGQSCFANLIQYSASNAHVKYSDRVAARVPQDGESMWLPFDVISKKTPQWVEMWNKQIGR
ncbi:extracellular solute-binding protein [Chitinasiproducens palmae]|uniref:Putative spermidine/putrescine transport system substrate-binding protein n=1 Tax=Chitinasiproducens palmae TaxID=1770053 RepID=A0A1H2PQ76_9BURK|nr:extracellular solute-binding protein [Chitinasiproducens palmae]SDV48973.1 putative spermidine/putrescine transport system substrate-binding protein [Chitinasiproducens palmae]